MGDHDEITTARHALGRHLAHLRKDAGHTQHSLARLVQYGRSSIANTETGRQHPERPFWTRCDQMLRTGGVLTAEYDRIADLNHRRHRSPARPRSASLTSDNAAVWWEPEDTIAARRSALTTSIDDDARLAHLEDEVRQAIADNERCPPATLVARLRPLRACVDQLMAGRQHPPQRARLYTAAAHLSGLLAALALDLRAFRVAHAYAAEAFDLAHAAQQPDTQAWARATQSLVAFYTGNHRDALAYAEDGLRHAGTGPHRIRLTINGQARALAHLGDRHGVDRAVDRAFRLLTEHPPDGQVSTSLTLGPYCPLRTAANAATAYLTLGHTTDVASHLTTAIAAFDTAQLRGPQALSRLDLATAHLHADDPDQAAELALQALTLTADQRFESVHQRTHQFLTAAHPLRHHRRIQDVADLLADRTQPRAAPPAGLRSPT
ncbi:helix-turn-helix domain-containing protein [Micromonospora sp. NBC_01655]|uniref:helix-turn-helix domain-containing protein n=1 Tax=Micromonospora sp. NBC_01655 TaxID=2975983 RepID=UPI0022558248|nr:helix-turn-helix transcriptional regulator [Micromonospora sp. NBC_01655]MCX4469435.1 helix-turn-helix domain-containing protein [Micromonospora sp. NBC_01655]